MARHISVPSHKRPNAKPPRPGGLRRAATGSQAPRLLPCICPGRASLERLRDGVGRWLLKVALSRLRKWALPDESKRVLSAPFVAADHCADFVIPPFRERSHQHEKVRPNVT